MVTRWGMSEELGMVSYAPRENAFLGTAFGGGAGETAHAEATARAIDDEVRRIVGECYDEAVRLLTEHRAALDALEKITLGPARSLLLNAKDRERVAYHEGGHAVLGVVVPGADPVERVTIVPRGPALGVTYQRPEEDRYNYDEAYLRGRIVGALGGRVAEEIVYGSRTTGAESDIEQVTGLARRMVTRWGMSEELGMISYAPRENAFLGGAFGGGTGEMAHSEATARAIDDEVRRIVGECYDEAVRLLSEHRGSLDALAKALIERETLDEAEILAVTGLERTPVPGSLPRMASAVTGGVPGDGISAEDHLTAKSAEER
jgi:cell division protease FtsH